MQARFEPAVAADDDVDPMHELTAVSADDDSPGQQVKRKLGYEGKLKRASHKIISLTMPAVAASAFPSAPEARVIRVYPKGTNQLWLHRDDVPWLVEYVALEVASGGVVQEAVPAAVAASNCAAPGVHIRWDFRSGDDSSDGLEVFDDSPPTPTLYGYEEHVFENDEGHHFEEQGENKAWARPDIGNIGYFFGNWGPRARDRALQANIDLQLKRNPAMVIGLAECERRTQEILDAPPGEPYAAVAARGGTSSGSTSSAAVAAPLDVNDALSWPADGHYLTLRGQEEPVSPVSVLLGVRRSVAHSLILVYWEKRREGTYKGKSGGGKKTAWSWLLIGEIVLHKPVGTLGLTQRVAVVHMHNMVANKDKGFSNAHASFWPWIAEKIRSCGVDVLIGGFQYVVPEGWEGARGTRGGVQVGCCVS